MYLLYMQSILLLHLCCIEEYSGRKHRGVQRERERGGDISSLTGGSYSLTLPPEYHWTPRCRNLVILHFGGKQKSHLKFEISIAFVQLTQTPDDSFTKIIIFHCYFHQSRNVFLKLDHTSYEDL